MAYLSAMLMNKSEGRNKHGDGRDTAAAARLRRRTWKASSFSEAAKTMHLSQAALKRVDQGTGDPRRRPPARPQHPQRLLPSIVGEAFEPMARRVLASLDEALESLTNLKELRRGLVRVAAPETLSCTLLPELIATYNSRHPGVDVRFDDVPIQAGTLANLQNGSTDIGFGPAGAH